MTNGPIQEFHIDNDQVEIVKEFIFLGSSVNTDGNCNNDIRRRLLKDINRTTTIRIIKTMVFPITTYGCESWTMKQADRKKVDAFELWC
jgi:hypothetical protein